MKLFSSPKTISAGSRQATRDIHRRWRRVRAAGIVGNLQAAYRKIQRSFIEYHAHATFKTRAAALIGLIGFPAFYVVWAWILPQPYESLCLRLIGAGLSLAVLLLPRAPFAVRDHGPLLSYLTLWYTVPFFFTFMLLMNEANTVWQLSLVSGFVYLVLLCDGLNAVILAVTGSLGAYLAFWLVTGSHVVPPAYVSVLPVLAFVLCGVAFLNYSNNLVLSEKMNAIGGLAAHIAHEMRTPLLGIRLDAEKMNSVIGDLMDAHRWAREHGWPGRISPSLQTGLPLAVSRITQHVISANTVIDMLLMNAAADRARSEMVVCSARKTVELAMERYNFHPDQRAIVDLDLQAEFQYGSVEILTVHVLFNLLKNALRAIEKTGKGRISITLETGPHQNVIVFRDTGPGMPPEVANNLFLPFFSNEAIGIGTGIGLSFCRTVVESFDGTIRCTSVQGVGTEFLITFPANIPTRTAPLSPTSRPDPAVAAPTLRA